MSKAFHFVSARTIKRIPSCYPNNTTSCSFLPQSIKVFASSRKDDLKLISKKGSRIRRRLVTISTGGGDLSGNWTSDYLVSLKDLHLEDLIQDKAKDAEVTISLSIHKHASFGFSVDGRILTSFTRKCSNCSSTYCRQIDTNFNVFVLQSSQKNGAVPEIGGDDPSVIYVKPGHEADFDEVIQDTIRFTALDKDTCSESCKKSEVTMQIIDADDEKNSVRIDERWYYRLLELRNALL